MLCSRRKVFTSSLFLFVLFLQYKIHVTKQPPLNFKTILYWNPMFGRQDFWLGTGSKNFEKCVYKNCYATYNRNVLPVEKFDAIMFHAPEYTHFLYGKPRKRHPKQIYIFYSLESPRFTPNYINKYCDNFYNWTVTYRSDSDIVRRYGFFDRQETNYQPPSVEDINNRSHKIAWLVSKCNVSSKRQLLYQKINDFIPVDVFGKCGKLSCQKFPSEECYQMVEANYKFYLSFENSICQDYVTEKLFYILKKNIVPIVYGGVNYDRIAPPHSVINVMDFESLQDLVDYLQYLDENPIEYLKFFEWKKNYIVNTDRQTFLCNLCKKLNEPVRSKTYKDIVEWWQGKNLDKCSTDFIDHFM